MAERTILVPIDLAHESSWTKVLPEAFDSVAQTGGSVTVMTVVPDIMAGLDWRYAIRGEMGGSEELDMRKLVTEAEERLRQIVAEYVPDGMEVETIARHGVIYEEILNVAEELDVDQIVMSAHRPSLSDYLIGPNTSRVVRHASCSVNVVR
jgi:universal stress protein F